MRRPASAGLCRLNQASLGCDSQLSKGNTVGRANQFGIIRKAALYAGHAPATIEQFRALWRDKGLPELAKPARKRHEATLFDNA